MAELEEAVKGVSVTGFTETPINDWLNDLNESSRPAFERAFLAFLRFWAEKEGRNVIGVGTLIIPPTKDDERLAVKMLEERFAHQASPDPRVRFIFDNYARLWFNEMKEHPEKYDKTRHTCESYVGRVMSFFKFHRSRIQPGIQFLGERTRKKYEISKEEIDKAIVWLAPGYRLSTKCFTQAAARPDSWVQVEIEDIEFNFMKTDFAAVRFRHSKRGAGWGSHGYLGPEVVAELRLYLGGRKTGLVFNFEAASWSLAWQNACERAGIAKTADLNKETPLAKKQNLLNLYRIRGFFKSALDNADISQDWQDRLMSHKLKTEDDAYTSEKLFNVWRERVYPKVSFEPVGVVTENLELHEQVKTLKEVMAKLLEQLKPIMDIKGASPATFDELLARLKMSAISIGGGFSVDERNT